MEALRAVCRCSGAEEPFEKLDHTGNERYDDGGYI